MIAFRHARHTASAGHLVHRFQAAWNLRPATVEALLAAGRLEQAVVDCWAAEADEWEDRRQALVGITLGAARRLRGQRAELPALPRLPGGALTVGEPEGVRFYGLWPSGWAEAARSWQLERPRQAVWVLGLRTMGSVLAPMAMAGLEPADGGHRLSTLRPRGDPNQRHIAAGPRLQRKIQHWPGDFLIVDEGPGLSGSSIGGTMRWLAESGITEERVAILASWRPAADTLHSPYARTGWQRWQVLTAPGLPAPPGREIGGGRWRAALWRHGPAWGEHERRKILLRGGRAIAKFAGLGGYGAATGDRARALARAGWGPVVEECGREGWIVYRRMECRQARFDREWAEFAGRYLAWVGAHYTFACREAPSAELREMLAANLLEAAGAGAMPEPPAGPVAMLDGRMLPPEWGLGVNGWVKFDATDHGDDPFFPGPADIAWDLAAIETEFGPALGTAVRAEYSRRSGDDGADLRTRLRWHALAYAAFRWAYCRLAAERTEGTDAAWFHPAARLYRARLRNGAVRVSSGRMAG